MIAEKIKERVRPDLTPLIQNADAMAHFDALAYLFKIKFAKDLSVHEMVVWLQKKIERNWNKKLTLPEARAMVKETYVAAKLPLDATLALQDE